MVKEFLKIIGSKVNFIFLLAFITACSSPSKIRIEDYWQNGVKVVSIIHNENNHIDTVGVFPDGLVQNYDINFLGRKRLSLELNHLNGKRNGLQKVYNRRGNLFVTSNWKMGVQHGEMIIYHKNGEKMSLFNFSNGKLDGKHLEFLEDGTKLMETHYLDGNYHGPHTVWYPNIDQIVFQVNYWHGLYDGYFKRWYSNGQLSEEAFLSKGIPIGIMKSYYPNGVVKSEGFVEDGKIIWRKCKDENDREIECEDTIEEQSALDSLISEAKHELESINNP